jgi:hypothetical protein
MLQQLLLHISHVIDGKGAAERNRKILLLISFSLHQDMDLFCISHYLIWLFSLIIKKQTIGRKVSNW